MSPIRSISPVLFVALGGDLLKATSKKLITVPGYTRRDGSVVPPHQKMVHYNPDVLFADVAAGKGSHSQKKAHAALSAKKWWQEMSVDDQAVAVMALATDVQDKASASAVVSGWKKTALAGKNPTAAQWTAFQSLDTKKQGALLDAISAAGLGWSHLKPPAAVAPAVADVTAQMAAAPDGGLGHPDLPADKMVGPGWNKDDWGDFSDAPPAAPPAIDPADLDAHSKLAAMESGPHYQKVSIAKLKADPAWQKLSPADKHAQAMALYQQLQTAASQSAAVSVAKKAMLAGKAPSKAQYAALMAAGLDVQAKLATVVGVDKYHDLMMAAQAAYGRPANAPASGGEVTSKLSVTPVQKGELPGLSSKIAKHGAEHAQQEIHAALYSQYPSKMAIFDSAGLVVGAIAYGVNTAGGPGSDLEVHHLGSVVSGGGAALLNHAKKAASKLGKKVTLFSTPSAIKFYEKQGFAQVAGAAPGLMTWNGSQSNELSPKDGDTKPGADGALIFNDGRWHKVADLVSPAFKKLVSSASDKGFLEGLLESPGLFPMNAAYVKDALSKIESAAAAPAPVKPTTGAAVAHGAAMAAKQQALIDALVAQKKAGDAGVATAIIGKAPFLLQPIEQPGEAPTSTSATKIANVSAMDVPATPGGAPDALAAKVSKPAVIMTNTTAGHNKIWSVSVNGNKMMTKWGKIGAIQQSSIKEFATENEAHAAVKNLIKQKKAGGYELIPDGQHEWDAPTPTPEASAAPSGPKEGDTKQGVGGMLVLKDGHWVLANPGESLKLKTKGKTQSWLKEQLPYTTLKSPSLSKAVKAASVGDVAGLLAALDYSIKHGFTKSKANIAALLKLGGASFPEGHFSDVATPAAAASITPASAPKVAKVTASEVPASGGAPISGSKAVSVGDLKVQSMDDWKQTGPQAGSNPGGQFTDKLGGKWYVKFPSTDDHAKNELLAAKFYEMLGVAGPKLKLVSRGGKIGVASKWVKGTSQQTPAKLKTIDGALSNFAVDAWLANWDVVGTGYDNLKVGPDGKAIRIDAGGSLLYRAQGEAKGAAFGDAVAELESLVDPGKNSYSAAVFSGITKQQMLPGLKQLAKLKPSQIETLVGKIGPGSDAEKAALTAKLIARRSYILSRYGIEDLWSKAPPDESKLVVDASKLPKPIDFNNIYGTGKGLSSKKHVNDQNSKDSAALVKFAARGNLTGLKDYKYDAVNKETGAAIGKKPIADHPAAKLKHQWAELVTHLQSIAYPPAETLPMPSLGLSAGSAAEVSDAVGYYHPSDRVETVSAENRMGFFMKLASVDAADDALAESKWSFLTASSSFIKNAGAAYKGYSRLTKDYVSHVQSSGHINHVWSQGKVGNVAGLGATKEKIAATLYNEATEVPEGTMLWRWMNDSAGTTMKSLLDAKPGDTFQNTDSMCSSYKKSWGNAAHFGGHIRLKIRCAKGSKAIVSLGSDAYGQEGEFTTLPGARFLIVSSKKGIPGNPNGVDVDCIMLPPDDGYVAELGKLSSLVKAITIGSTWQKLPSPSAKSTPRSVKPCLIIRSRAPMSLPAS